MYLIMMLAMLTFNTLLECVSLAAWQTDTGGNVVDDGAGSSCATRARTRVYTPRSRAGLALAAVRVEDALWPAAVAGVTQQARGTGAAADPGLGGGSGSRPTWTRVTDIVLS